MSTIERKGFIVRMAPELVARLDEKRGRISRTKYVEALIVADLEPAAAPAALLPMTDGIADEIGTPEPLEPVEQPAESAEPANSDDPDEWWK